MTWDPNEGQVLPGSEFGGWITKLAMRSNAIVDIGCYYGLGTTECIRAGLVRPEQRVWCFELAEDAFSGALVRHAMETRISFVNGPLDNSLLPPWLDLVVLDGGDSDSFGEFMTLKDVTTWFALDDTNAAKNQRTLAYCNDNGWRVLAQNQEERQGWAIVENPSPSSIY